MDTLQSFRISDIVGNNVTCPHDSPSWIALAQPYPSFSTDSSCIKSRIGFNLSKEEAGQQPCLYLKNPPVADGITKTWMRHQGVHAPFIGVDDTSASALCQRHSLCPRNEIRRAQLAVIDEADSHRIRHQRAELLHEIKR